MGQRHQTSFQLLCSDMKILSILLLLFGLAGCSDSNTSTTNTGDGVTGDLIGSVLLADHRGRAMTNHSGVTVQIEGTSFSTITDTAGNWTIHNLPSKTYAITFSKPEFYSYRDASFSFLGGTPVRYRTPLRNDSYVRLGGLPRFTVSLDAIIMPRKTTIDSTNTILYTNGELYAHTSDDAPDSVTIGAYVIISRDPNLRIEDPSTYFYLMPVQGMTYARKDTVVNFGTTLGYTWFFSEKVHTGDMLYFKGYPVIGNPMQYDPIKNQDVFIGYSTTASNVLSAVMQ